ncbi:hypothetical protein CYMTET_7355, partial [Cymbomonas tetramitiformis]
VHFRTFPDEVLLKCNDSQTVRAHFYNSLKEAMYIMYGSAGSVMQLSQQVQTQLWKSIEDGMDMETYDTSTSTLPSSTTQPNKSIRAVPVRMYLMGDKRVASDDPQVVPCISLADAFPRAARSVSKMGAQNASYGNTRQSQRVTFTICPDLVTDSMATVHQATGTQGTVGFASMLMTWDHIVCSWQPVPIVDAVNGCGSLGDLLQKVLPKLFAAEEKGGVAVWPSKVTATVASVGVELGACSPLAVTEALAVGVELGPFLLLTTLKSHATGVVLGACSLLNTTESLTVNVALSS